MPNTKRNAVPGNDKEIAGIRLFQALERLLRPMLNGHPTGHDAVVGAKKALERAAAVGLMFRPPTLQCNCTVCALERRKSPSARDASPELTEKRPAQQKSRRLKRLAKDYMLNKPHNRLTDERDQNVISARERNNESN